jgi:hypothetical protein
MTTEETLTATVPSQQIFATTFRVLIIAAVGMAALLALLSAAGHDQLWFLLMARRWLGGATLYGPEIFDSNPPLVVWVSSVPVALATALHVHATLVAKLLVSLLETAAAYLSFFFLRRARSTPRYEVPALLFAGITIFYAVPARDFGQRDHLTAFLILPYILAAACRERLILPRTLAGALAAIAICLKPHHALIPVTIELALLFTTSRFFARKLGATPNAAKSSPRVIYRLEPLLILFLGLLFLVCVRRFAPLYFTNALPLTRATYWAIGDRTLPQLVWEARELMVLAAASLTLTLRFKPPNPIVPLLHLAAVAAGLAYFVQGTGWYYQQLPAISLFACALVLQLLDLFATNPVRLPTWLPKGAAALTVLSLALAAHFTGYPFTRDRALAIASPDPAFFTALPPGTPVAILTTTVEFTMMPVERYQLLWAQRTNNLWFLPAILGSELSPAHPHLTPGTTMRLDMLEHRWMVEDLNRWHPQLILVQRCQDPAVHCQHLAHRHENLLAWFARDPAFRAVFAMYLPAGSRGEFDAYALRPTSGK